MQKAPGQYPTKKKRQSKIDGELIVDNSTNNSSSNINKISVIGKGKYCLFFTAPKDRQVKHYYPIIIYTEKLLSSDWLKGGEGSADLP